MLFSDYFKENDIKFMNESLTMKYGRCLTYVTILMTQYTDIYPQSSLL